MPDTFFTETFDGPELMPQLQWLYPPQSWRLDGGALVVEPDAETDYWQRTHYGFQADNGHLLFAEIGEDFVLTTTVHARFANQYDQAGLMVRISPECWLKTSLEYESEAPNRMGAVVTNSGHSDWSTQDFPDDVTAYSLRVRREGSTYFVEYTLDLSPTEETAWTQIRLARLLEDDGNALVQCGLYACSPRGAGFSAAFDYLELKKLN